MGDMIANLVAELKDFSADEERKKASLAGSSIRSARWNCSRPATTRPRSMWTRSAKSGTASGAAAQGHCHARPPLRAEPDLLQGTFHVHRRGQEAAGGSAAPPTSRPPTTRLRRADSRGRAGRQGSERKCERFEKKLYDLELTRNVSIQMAPQIRLIQSSNQLMAEKIQTSLNNTIPCGRARWCWPLALPTRRAP